MKIVLYRLTCDQCGTHLDQRGPEDAHIPELSGHATRAGWTVSDGWRGTDRDLCPTCSHRDQPCHANVPLELAT